MSGNLPSDERFRDGKPLRFEGNELACIENDGVEWPDYVGKVWLSHNWLAVSEARALRDWLNEVLP